jgi:hypothetical protein
MKEKRVQLKEDYDGMLAGSVFVVEKETKTLYKGIWSSMMGSYNVSVPKKKCKQYREKKIKIDYSLPKVKKIVKKLIKLVEKMR